MPKNSREDDRRFHQELMKQIVGLATAGFGLAAALAWNSLIQEVINTYVKRFVPGYGKMVSLFLYAIIVTIIAVTVTYYLSKLSRKVADSED